MKLILKTVELPLARSFKELLEKRGIPAYIVEEFYKLLPERRIAEESRSLVLGWALKVLVMLILIVGLLGSFGR